MKNYKVVCITNDLEAYPEYTQMTLAYPDLVKYVEDDFCMFVVNEHKPTDWFTASEFFACVTDNTLL